MKQFCLLSLAFLGLLACNKEVDQTSDLLPKIETEKVDGMAIKYVSVNLKVSDSEEALRVLYTVTPDGTGRIKNLSMAEKDVKLRIGVRRGEGETLVQDLVFNKQLGRNYATYSGQIAVPADGEGSYKISALFLGEVGSNNFLIPAENVADRPKVLKKGTAYTSIRRPNPAHLLQPNDEGILNINVPFSTRWQDFTVDQVRNVANPLTLYFEPVGTVLRLRIKNESASAKTFHRIKFVTNAFIDMGYFYSDETREGYPAWYANNREEIVYSFPNGVTVEGKPTGGEAKYSPWFYMWVNPRKTLLSEGLDTSASLSQQPSGEEYKVSFRTKKYLPVGSVPMTLVYNDGHNAEFSDLSDNEYEFGVEVPQTKISLDYFAKFALNAEGTGFVTDYQTNNPNIGFFDAKEALDRFSKPFEIDGVHYSLPTRAEMASLLPPVLDASGNGMSKYAKDHYSYDVVEPNIKIGSVQQAFKADYYFTGTELYAIRFKDNKDNLNRTAFRYSVEGDDTQRVYKIEAIQIGAKSLTLEDVIKPAFWATGEKDRTITTLRLPLYGSGMSRINRTHINRHVYFLTSSQYDVASIYTGDMYHNLDGVVTLSRMDRIYPILLFKR